ncbi:MAG: hypothetical protein EA365_06940 [Gloeocapsa sp. DLM2.Bin57]|nr:MAG: hypothetical protein EA365_06940 [Gloeocapsa sp. DLM2.Bin57]
MNQFLAQSPTDALSNFFTQTVGQDIWSVIKAILILVVGWIIATIVRGVVEKLLNQTDVDNKIAAWVTGNSDEKLIPIEKWVANVAFWLVILFAIIATLNSLQLDAVSAPLNSLLNQITSFIPQIAGAALLLGLAWLLATIAKMLVTNTLRGMRLDERVGEQLRDDTTTTATTSNQFTLSDTIGNAIYWLIFLIFIPGVLSTLQLEGTLGPVQQLLNDILGILPRILSAILIGAVGWFIAQIVRKVVTNLLTATGINRIGGNFGLPQDSGSRSLSWIIGTIAYVFILIPTGIEALNKLNIESISRPGTEMLQQVLNKIPQIFSAAVVLILAYIVAKYVSDFVTDILTEVGFDNVFQWLGIQRPTTTETTFEPEATSQPTQSGQPTIVQLSEKKTSKIPQRTPSELVGFIITVGIMLIAALTAVDILQIDALRTVVGIILFISGKVLLALLILAIGLYLANFAFNFITSSGTSQSRTLAQAARIAIIILSATMALQQLGIAPDIINLAFGLLLGGIAVAIALAFGLGGRDIAAEQIRNWLNSLKNEQ